MVDILTGPAGHSAIRRAETAGNTAHDSVPIHRRLTVDMIARGLGKTKKCLTVMMGLVKVRSFFLTQQQLNPLRSWWNIGRSSTSARYLFGSHFLPSKKSTTRSSHTLLATAFFFSCSFAFPQQGGVALPVFANSSSLTQL